MADAAIEPHDKMRGRDISKVARGQQAPRPLHEPSTVSDAPPPPEVDPLKIGTAPTDFRFPCTNQTRHCYVRYLEYHQRWKAKGDEAPECDKFQRYYRSLCPTEWVMFLLGGTTLQVVAWNEQRKSETFPCPF